MANPIRGETTLALPDGRSFTLVMDMEALIEGEQAYGKPLARLLADANDGFVGALRAMVFGSMRAHHPAATMADATAILLADQAAVAAALTRAVEIAFPDATKASGEGKEPGKVRSPAGKTSGANGARQG